MGEFASFLSLPAAGVLVAACVAAPVEKAARSAAKPGQHAVSPDGMSMLAEVTEGAAGLRLTAEGAKPVPGLTVVVSRASAPMATDEGALAKKAARMGCAEAGGRFEEAAIGAYDRAGTWRFAGACG